ncbi:hypothetical protein EV127DRAFT_27550 [Xylaria flabelliformis]|nr:hypothetical protein EV127DRAFT_27550 [Xylaria flabelliformis]
MQIFEQQDLFERREDPVPHHANTQSFVLSVTAGCPICRAVLSELDESRKSLLDANTISFTECSPQMTVDGESRECFYSLHFTWISQGHPRCFWLFLIKQHHGGRLRCTPSDLNVFNRHMSLADSPHCPIPSRCSDWNPLIFQVESSITTTGQSYFGQIVNGSLRLTGLLFLVQDIITASSKYSRPILPYLDAPTTSGGIQPTTLLLPLRCVQLHREDDDCHFYWVTGLLLDPVDALASTYQRCGMLSTLSTDGVRDIGIELTESPFTAKYSDDKVLETIRLI